MGIGNLKQDFVLKGACKSPEGVVLDLASVKKDGAGGAGGKTDELAGFKLLVSPGSGFPAGAQIIHVGGNVTSITMSEMVFEPSLDPALFKPDFPKGIDLNDLRQKP